MNIDHSADEFRPRQIYEQVAERIRSSILSGAFPAGSRLPSERELAQRLGVSRPAVREAIGALQNLGLVVTRHGSGTYVTTQGGLAGDTQTTGGPSDFSPLSILEVRLLFEPALARRAARGGKRDAAAEEYLRRMSEVRDLSDPQQQALWSECDRLFHRQIALMGGDALWVRMADEIARSMNQPLWRRLCGDGICDPERIPLYVAEHRLIYEAIVTGDEDAAAFLVERHLQRVRKDISTRE